MPHWVTEIALYSASCVALATVAFVLVAFGEAYEDSPSVRTRTLARAALGLGVLLGFAFLIWGMFFWAAVAVLFWIFCLLTGRDFARYFDGL